MEALLLLGTLAVATAVGLLWRARTGRLRTVAAPAAVTEAPHAGVWQALGIELGERATFVQFSSAFCQPCRATRRILADVAALVPGVVHVEVDAESQLDAVRALDVRRTPTTFVVGADGHVLRRAVGQPRRDDVLATLAAAVPAGHVGGAGAD